MKEQEGRMVTDGYQVMCWPEFQRVVEKFDLKPVAGVYVISLDYDSEDFGRGVYFDPDFMALCKRLGVFHGAHTRSITIRIGEGRLPVIEHSYVACEPPEFTVDKPVVIDKEAFLRP